MNWEGGRWVWDSLILGHFLQGINEAAQGGEEEISLERRLVYRSSHCSQTGKMALDFPHPLANQEVVLMCWERRWGCLKRSLRDTRFHCSHPTEQPWVTQISWRCSYLVLPRACSAAGGEAAAPGKAALCPFTGCWRFPGFAAPTPAESWKTPLAAVGAPAPWPGWGLLQHTQGCTARWVLGGWMQVCIPSSASLSKERSC